MNAKCSSDQKLQWNNEQYCQLPKSFCSSENYNPIQISPINTPMQENNLISSKWIQPVACCVWLWPKSQPAGSGSPCQQCLSGSRHFSLCIIMELQAPCQSEHSEMLTVSCCTDQREALTLYLKGPRAAGRQCSCLS